MRKPTTFLVTLCLLLGACSSKLPGTPTLENIAMKSFPTPAKHLSTSAASQVGKAAPTQSLTPGAKPEPTRTAAPGATPQSSTTLEPAPEGYISRDYYSIQLPEGLAEWSEIEWRDQDYDAKLFYTEGHAYFVLLNTSASAFDQLEARMISALKSIIFYAGPDSPRP